MVKELFPSNDTSDSSGQRTWSEPSPDWLKAIKEYNWLWYFHVYGFATSFAAQAMVCAVCLVYFRKSVFARQRVHLTAMNTGLLVASCLRSMILFWDPYASNSTSSEAQVLVCIISWGMATALITSGFSVLLLIFLETTKTSLGPQRVKNLPFLLSISLTNILYLILSDLLAWFYPEVKVMIFICHVTFAIWGFAVSTGFLVAGTRMWRNLQSSLGATFHIRALERDSRRLKRLLVFMSLASVFGMGKFSLSLYTAIGEFGIFADIGYVKSWPWFVVQSALRVLETLMCVFIFLIAFNSWRKHDYTYPDIASGRRETSFTMAQLSKIQSS